MIGCTLNGKRYTVDFVPGRALREIDDAANMYRRLNQITIDAAAGKDVSGETLTVKEALDVMVKWFCLLFGNQFTPDDMYDYYPADCIVEDMAKAVMAVNSQASEVLSGFPTKPTAIPAKK